MPIGVGKGGEIALVLKVKDDGSVVLEKFAGEAEKSADKSSKAWGDAGKALGTLAAAAAATSAALIKGSLDMIDASSDLAQTVGVNVEQFSRLAFAVDQLGDVTRDELGSALRFMVKNLSDAAAGTGEAKDAIRDLGLNAAELARIAPDQAIIKIVDAMEGFERQGDRLALTQEIFGRGNSKMALALTQGAGAFRTAITEAERYGVVISGDLAAKQGEFERQTKRLKAEMQGFALALTEETLPAMIATAEAMNDFFARSDSGRGAIDALGAGVRGVAFVALQLVGSFEILGKGLGALAAASVQAVKLNFSEASEILKAYAEDRKQIGLDIAAAEAKLFEAPPPIVATEPSSDTGGTGRTRGSEETDKRREELQEQLQAVHDASLSETAILAEKYVRNFQLLQAGQAAELISMEQFNIDRAGLALRYEEDLLALKDQVKGTEATRLANDFAALQQSTLTETELLRAKYDEQQIILFEAWESRLATDTQYQELSKALEDNYQKGITEISDREAQKRNKGQKVYRKLDLESASFTLGSLTNLMQSGSKKQFEIGKKAAIAQAIIKTYEGATAAFTSLAGIPIVGPALGAVAAAAAIALGLSQVQQIKSQSFGGGGGGGGAVPTFSANPNTGLPVGTPGGDVGEFGPAQTPSPLLAAPRAQVNITLVGSQFSYQQVAEEIIPLINEAAGNGADIQVRAA
jgi:hypothetical protein